MTESPTPSGGERAPPTGTHPPAQPATHLRLDDVDADAERPVDDIVDAAELGESADIPIEAPIEDVIDQRTEVRFDDEEVHPGTG